MEADIADRHVDIVEVPPPWDSIGEHTRFPIARLRQAVSRPDNGASTGATATAGSTSTNASGRPRTNIRSLLVLVLRWSRIGTTDVSPTTAPKNFVSEFVKACSGAFALDGAPSNPSLSTIPADGHSDSPTFRDNPFYSAMPHTLRTRLGICSVFAVVQLC